MVLVAIGLETFPLVLTPANDKILQVPVKKVDPSLTF